MVMFRTSVKKKAKKATKTCLAVGVGGIEGFVAGPLAVTAHFYISLTEKESFVEKIDDDGGAYGAFVYFMPVAMLSGLPYGFFRGSYLAYKNRDEGFKDNMRAVTTELFTFDCGVESEILSKFTQEEAQKRAQKAGVSLRKCPASLFKTPDIKNNMDDIEDEEDLLINTSKKINEDLALI